MADSLWAILKEEFKPFDGRLGTAWRVAVICALTAMVFMIYELPLVAIGCYLVLFVMKPNNSESTLMAIAICILVTIVVFSIFSVMDIALASPVARMAILVLGSFIFLYIGAASQLGPVGSIIALVIGFIMSLLGMIPFGEVATRALLYALLMALVPMGVLIVCNVAFGLSPVRMVRRGVAERLELVAGLLDGEPVRDEVLKGMREGNESFDKAMIYIRLFHLLPSAESAQLRDGLRSSHTLLLAAATLPLAVPQSAARERMAQQCRTLAADVRRGGMIQPMAAVDEDAPRPDAPLGAIHDIVAVFPETPAAEIKPGPLPKVGFFFSDIRTNPDYQRYALKTTFAAVVCYLIYTAIQWQDIHTAMVTCYVGALGTTGETLHKLTLRIIGCLIGAAMGVASILFLMPHMTSIGQLMLLVFAGILCAGWVSSGSERIAYGGVQIGLAFLMTVLQGFGPDVELSVAMDRIMGILLGNVVLYLVFTRVWPVSAARAAQRHLETVLEMLHRPADESQEVTALTLRTGAERAMHELDVARDQLLLSHFEPSTLRPANERLHELRQLADRLEQVYLAGAFPDIVGGPAIHDGPFRVSVDRIEHDIRMAYA